MKLSPIGDFSVQGADVSIFEADAFRPCGDCKACCTVIGVVELNKDNYQRCQHVCDSGCKIYEAKPPSCAEYYCWYTAGLVKERPDRLGLIVDYQMVPLPGSIRVWEVRKGASDTRKGRHLIAKLRKTYDCEIVVVNSKTTTLLRHGTVCETPKAVAEPFIEDSLRQEVLQSIKQIALKNESRCNHEFSDSR